MRNFEEFFSKLVEYKEEHGNCLVPARYVTTDGYKLGSKINCIRSKDAKLDEDEVSKLNEIGFAWRINNPSKTFEEKLAMILEYKAVYGDCHIPRDYITQDGIKLGNIVANIRYGKNKFTKEQYKIMEDIGLTELHNRKPVFFEEFYDLIVEYKKKNGNCLVPQKYVTENGIPLGIIVAGVRQRKDKMPQINIELLEELGFVWKVKNRKKFDEVCEMFLEYKQEFGNLLIPMRYTTEDGIKLGAIVANMRGGKIKLSIEQKNILDDMGFVWKVNKKNN